MLRKLTAAASFIGASIFTQSAAFAANLPQGSGTQPLGFVGPLQTFSSALQIAGGSMVVIAIVTLVASHMMHREDMGGLMKNLVFVIIGGAVVMTAGSFITSLGVTQGALI
jgi:hypothetical protein